MLEIFQEFPGLPDRRHDQQTVTLTGQRLTLPGPPSNANLKPPARQAPQLAARYPPHFFAMSACAPRTTPGTVQPTRSGQFRTVLPVPPKGGAAVGPTAYWLRMDCGRRTTAHPA